MFRPPPASPSGLGPSRTLPLTRPAFGSIRTSRLRTRSVVHTEPYAETSTPVYEPTGIFAGAGDAAAAPAARRPAPATIASVRRYRKVASLYHKVAVNGTRRRRHRRPHDPPRPLPDESAPEADDRGGAGADGTACGGLPRLRARRRRRAVDPDRPRKEDGDAALDDALPARSPRAARPRRAHPEPGRPAVVPDPSHGGGRAVARRGAAGGPRARGNGRGTARLEAGRVSARGARGAARGGRRRARRARLALDALRFEEGGETGERLVEIDRLLARLPPEPLDPQHPLLAVEDGLDPADD